VGHDPVMTTIAVLDIGKTNIKLSAATQAGAILETLAVPNHPAPPPPYRHTELGLLEAGLRDGLSRLAARHSITHFVACSHGSAGVLVNENGPVMPMIDYEQPVPPAIDREYAASVGSYGERGSRILMGASHLARQLLWLERDWPEAVARARWFLALPQYWARRLSAVAVSEFTSLSAQSHLWNVCAGHLTPFARAHG
jgi:sugar (pentulose or hexulose) kinase